ncbi:hypothetical protein BFN03_10000 [Rhodococcus sp. WMMA185]|nr:hypothetical protein BFN03_10000 [Rhodococcus sp. WMMA185]
MAAPSPLGGLDIGTESVRRDDRHPGESGAGADDIETTDVASSWMLAHTTAFGWRAKSAPSWQS